MQQILAVAGAIVIIGGALAILYKGGRWMLRGMRQLFRVADEVLGDELRPGWGKRLCNIEDRLTKVEDQLRPNGGTSLHDKVSRIATATGADREVNQ